MTNIKVYDWVQQVEQLGAGELLVTSMGHDGMKQGFDIEHLAKINPCKYSNHCFWWWWQCTTLCRII